MIIFYLLFFFQGDTFHIYGKNPLQKEVIDPIVINILSSILYAIGGAIIFRIYLYLKKRFNPFKRFFFRVKSSSNDLYIAYATIPNVVNGKKLYFLEEGDVTALYTMVDYLSEFVNRNQIIVKKHEDLIGNFSNICYFISVSGPIYNKVTKLYLSYSNAPFSFDLKQKSIVSGITGKEYQTAYNASNTVESCHGIIICSYNSTSIGKPQRFVILAGNSSLSTYVSVVIFNRILCDTNFRNELKKQIKSLDNRWAILFKVKNMDIDSQNFSFADISLKHDILEYATNEQFK